MKKVRNVIIALSFSLLFVFSIAGCEWNLSPRERILTFGQLRSIAKIDKWDNVNNMLADGLFSDWTNKKLSHTLRYQDADNVLNQPFVMYDYEYINTLYVKGQNEIVVQEQFSNQTYPGGEKTDISSEDYFYYSKTDNMEYYYMAKLRPNHTSPTYHARFNDGANGFEFDSITAEFSASLASNPAFIKSITQVFKPDNSYTITITVDMDKLFKLQGKSTEYVTTVKTHAMEIGYELKANIVLEFNTKRKCDRVTILQQELEYRNYQNGLGSNITYYPTFCKTFRETILERHQETVNVPDWFDIENYLPNEDDYAATTGTYLFYQAQAFINNDHYHFGFYGSYMTPSEFFSKITPYGLLDMYAMQLNADLTGIVTTTGGNTINCTWKLLISKEVELTIGNTRHIYSGLYENFTIGKSYWPNSNLSIFLEYRKVAW
ncbi:MAG: hypothetical protein FWE53_04345 [Firmicutes bacterium]|nr:hypothetical protein [Bacillota bacterium]